MEIILLLSKQGPNDMQISSHLHQFYCITIVMILPYLFFLSFDQVFSLWLAILSEFFCLIHLYPVWEPEEGI